MAELNRVRTPTMRFAAIASLAVAGLAVTPAPAHADPTSVTFVVTSDSPADGGPADGACDVDASS